MSAEPENPGYFSSASGLSTRLTYVVLAIFTCVYTFISILAPILAPPCDETIDRTKSDTGRCSGRDPFNTLISDELVVPDLPKGEYVLGIRWDCEKSAQVLAPS